MYQKLTVFLSKIFCSPKTCDKLSHHLQYINHANPDNTDSNMIQKKAQAKINRLQIIETLEADYNMILKYFWPKLTTNLVEIIKPLEKSQLGTRIYWSTNDAFIINIFILRHSQLNHNILVEPKWYKSLVRSNYYLTYFLKQQTWRNDSRNM